jgi:hypothetical protein
MQAPGYDPTTDRDVKETMAELTKHFDVGPVGSAMSDVTLQTTVIVRHEHKAPLGFEGVELRIRAGTGLTLTAETSGDAKRPKLKLATLSSAGEGMVVHHPKYGDVIIRSVKIDGHGEFDFEVDPRLAHIAVGGAGMFASMTSGGNQLVMAKELQGVRDTPIKSFEDEAKEQLKANAPARFEQIIRDADHTIPGYSLVDIFDVDHWHTSSH